MSEKFYCQRKGGIRRGDFGPKSMSRNENEELVILEGTAEKGPWYDPLLFSDEQIEYYQSKGWISWIVPTAFPTT